MLIKTSGVRYEPSVAVPIDFRGVNILVGVMGKG